MSSRPSTPASTGASELQCVPAASNTVTKIRTIDRALASRCKLACNTGQEIAINYETRGGGWNRVTGVVRSVRSIKARVLKPFWEIIVERK